MISFGKKIGILGVLLAFGVSAAEYDVRWCGLRQPVRDVRVSAMPFNRVWPGHQRDRSQSEVASFVRFDATGAGTLDVRAKGIGRGEVRIRPLSAASRLTCADDCVSVALKGPEKAVLEFGGRYPTLHIFADPPTPAVPAPAPGGRLIRFGPGEHHPGVVAPRSGDVVWLDDGAVVDGELFVCGATNVTVGGRGVFTAAGFARMDERAKAFRRSRGLPETDTEHACSPFVVYGSTNVIIRDVILSDAPFWTLVVRNQSHDIRIENVKIVGNWRYNSDGIDVCASSKVTVRDCFVRSFDDCVIARGPYMSGERGAVSDLLVENCFLWCDWGCNVKVQAHEIPPSLIERVTVRNCTFANVSGTCVLVATRYGCESDTIRDLTVEDIELDFVPQPCEQLQKTDDAVFVPRPRTENNLVVAHAYGIGKSLGDQRTGELGDPNRYSILYENLTFRRMRAFGERKLRVTLATELPRHEIRNVMFEDLPSFAFVKAGNVKNVKGVK